MTLEYGYTDNITLKTRILNFIRKVFFIPFMERLLVKLNYNKPPNSFTSKLTPNHYQYKPGTIRKVQRRGINYVLDLSELMDWFIYFGFKDSARDELDAFVKPGQTVMDIGANMGEVSFTLAQKVGAQGKVISFEPDAINYNRFEKNHALNTFGNIYLQKVGLGSSDGKFKMDINALEPGNLGSNRVLPTEIEEDFENARDVHITTLDGWISENPIDQLSFIKIDIEGYEVEAIKGGIETIKRFKPVIYSELHDDKLKEHGSSARAYVDLLESIGYSLYPEDEIDLSQNLDRVHTDIICKIN